MVVVVGGGVGGSDERVPRSPSTGVNISRKRVHRHRPRDFGLRVGCREGGKTISFLVAG